MILDSAFLRSRRAFVSLRLRRPEHISLLAVDRARADEPWLGLTGHKLMIGDLGLRNLAESAAEAARTLFHRVQRLQARPDHVEVFPGAFSVSVWGRRLGGKRSAIVGSKRRADPAYRIAICDQFVRAMVVEIAEPPARAAELRARKAGPQAV